MQRQRSQDHQGFDRTALVAYVSLNFQPLVDRVRLNDIKRDFQAADWARVSFRAHNWQMLGPHTLSLRSIGFGTRSTNTRTGVSR
jgi:hypothetical protein